MVAPSREQSCERDLGNPNPQAFRNRPGSEAPWDQNPCYNAVLWATSIRTAFRHYSRSLRVSAYTMPTETMAGSCAIFVTGDAPIVGAQYVTRNSRMPMSLGVWSMVCSRPRGQNAAWRDMEDCTVQRVRVLVGASLLVYRL